MDKNRHIVEEGLDLDRIQEIARRPSPCRRSRLTSTKRTILARNLRIGVARDEAFNFYYRDNLELMELAGAKVVPFSPVHDASCRTWTGSTCRRGYASSMPGNCPKNAGMMRSLERAHERDLPIFAELRRADVPGGRSSGTAKA